MDLLRYFFYRPSTVSPRQLNFCPQMKASQPIVGKDLPMASEQQLQLREAARKQMSFIRRFISKQGGFEAFLEKVSEHLPRHPRCFASVFQGCTWNCHAKNFIQLKWDRRDAWRSEHIKRSGALSLLHPPTCFFFLYFKKFHSTLYCPRALRVNPRGSRGGGLDIKRLQHLSVD